MRFVARQFAGAPLTLGLLISWVLFEIARVTIFHGSDIVYRVCGLSWHGLTSYMLWQPFTYAFFHGDWVHLTMNGLLLLAVGSRLEWMIGQRSCGMIMLGGAAGSVAGGWIFDTFARYDWAWIIAR